MDSIYMDNGATSFPKAPGVAEAVAHYLCDVGININRGSYAQAVDAATIVLETRRRLARLFHFLGDESQVIFTPGATFGLNQILKGFVRPGDHVIVSSLEHNAVMRPLQELYGQGVEYSCIPADSDGNTDSRELNNLIRTNTRLILVNHASNVSGNVIPLEEISRICWQKGIPLAVDAAQTAGHHPIDFAALHLAALCVPGHKGLLGPQGLGALLLADNFVQELQPLLTGGTGSASDKFVQPKFLPDRFESGTQNLPGIFGLHAALGYLEGQGVENIGSREQELTESFLTELQNLPLRILGLKARERVAVISIDCAHIDNAIAAFRLEEEFGILTRCGLHCAPMAHQTLQSFPQGSIRFSLGAMTTDADVEKTVRAIRQVCCS
jgi:cysteine desulfurase family protein